MVPRVDKIVGPGNLYVTAAKRLVAFDSSIDMLAGPTEIVVTSERGNAADIASDLVAQAEHDPEALAILITTRADLAKGVVGEAKERSRDNPVAREALDRNGMAIVASTLDEAHHESPSPRASDGGCSKRSRLDPERRFCLRWPLVCAAHG